ncbi:(2Fe-2S)-binding protein [Sphingobium sp. CR28]|uniref:(2Fe-2S)-binding protein n=1 Tax=Sphingobium sp. CR28 TaxID=3400272 RepID=UPI003FEE1EC8
MPVNLTVNGKKRSVDGDPTKPLLWVLREDLDLVGTKFGCGAGLCGACTVHVDGAPTRACQTPVGDVDGMSITTIESVAASPAGKRIAAAWIEQDVPQCGYCQAGQIMSAVALLNQTPKPSDDDIDAAMQGNLCRCSTYVRIRAAIKAAAGAAA